MDFWVKTGQLLLSLSILIVLHEGGHFLPARWFKIRVEKFYLFFDPWFSLVKKKVGDTVYGIGWLPLGGYVKISGMIDESMDKEQMAKPPEPHEFRAKPAWQRLIVMVGGVTVNLILGFVIYMMVLFVWGRSYLAIDEATYGYHAQELMHEYGFENGDMIVSVGGVVPESYVQVEKEILLNDATEMVVLRNGQEVVIPFPDEFDQILLENGVKSNIFSPLFPFVADSIDPDLPAKSAGFLKGDSIVSLNGEPVPFYNDFSTAIREHKDEEVTVGFYRGGKLQSITLTTDTSGVVGIFPVLDFERWFKVTKLEYGFFESIPAGFSFGWKTLVNYVKSIKLIFTPAGATEVGGFGAIGGMFSATWDWQSFWMLTAFLSIMLAFLNILPIPALDGGHVMFLLWEMVTGKPAPQKIMERAQLVGMLLLLALVVYANGNDIYKLFTGD